MLMTSSLSLPRSVSSSNYFPHCFLWREKSDERKTSTLPCSFATPSSFLCLLLIPLKTGRERERLRREKGRDWREEKGEIEEKKGWGRKSPTLSCDIHFLTLLSLPLENYSLKFMLCLPLTTILQLFHPLPNTFSLTILSLSLSLWVSLLHFLPEKLSHRISLFLPSENAGPLKTK